MMAKRTMWLLIAGIVLLTALAAAGVLLLLRDSGLSGNGVYFIAGGART